MNQLPLGLIAQEVEPVLPELVLRERDAKEPLGLNYLGLVPVLVKGMQEQQAQIEAQRRLLDDEQQVVARQQDQITQQQKMIARQSSQLKQQQSMTSLQQSEIDGLRKLVCRQHSKVGVCRHLAPRQGGNQSRPERQKRPLEELASKGDAR